MKTKNEKTKLLLGHSLEWRVNTAGLLKELMDGYPGSGGIFYQPINIFRELLVQLTDRASEINDPVLNALLCRLSLYGEADPYSPDYNHKKLTETLNSKEYEQWRKRKIKQAAKEKMNPVS